MSRAICLFLKTFVSINVCFLNLIIINISLIKKFERFKKRVRFKLEIVIRDVLIK